MCLRVNFLLKGEYHSRDSVDSFVWEVQGQESCLPQAAYFWIASRNW